MVYRGHIKNGVAVLDTAVNLPDGTPVQIEVDPTNSEFWHGRSVEEQACEQGVGPITDFNRLAGEWPDDESVDDFLAAIRQSRV